MFLASTRGSRPRAARIRQRETDAHGRRRRLSTLLGHCVLAVAAMVAGCVQYFPKDAFRSASARSRTLKEWDEEPLHRSVHREAYRAVLFVGHYDVFMFRAEAHLDGSLTVTAKRNADPVHDSSTGMVSAGDWKKLQALLKQADFWNAPSRLDCDDRIYLKNVSCTIEGMKDGKFHVVHRFTPDEVSPGFFLLCDHFFELAGEPSPLAGGHLEWMVAREKETLCRRN
jgi:hypothetical protein